MSAVGEGLARARARIEVAATRRGRDPAGVALVAVSKGHPTEAIREAYAEGQRLFGESYAQELADKAAALADLTDLAWHFVGHLQSNKARVVAPLAAMVHTVDSPGLARELGKRVLRAGRPQLPVLVEVNVTREPQKHGASPGDLQEVLDAVAAEQGLRARGLMTIGVADESEASRRAFETLASLRALHGGPALLPELSMGMSDDLEGAIASGATLVRVGTAIFGPRG